MLKSKIAVQVVGTGSLADDAVMLGETYLKRWKIPQGQSVILKFGAYRQHVKVVPVPRYDGLRINQQLAREMGIPEGASLRLHYRAASATLALGPLIGVLISRDYPQHPDRPFGSITLFCKELVEACAAQGAYVYFFTPGGIGTNPASLDGWVYRNGWTRITMPLPDVVNNRLTSRKLENLEPVQRLIGMAKTNHQLYIFNEKFLDKHDVFDALGRDAALGKYLPESHLLRGFATLKTMSARYPVVFLKPVRGSLGKGIIRINRLDAQQVQATYTTAAGSRRQVYPSLSKLFASLSGKIKTVRYQIQQGLQLIEIQKRPVDFRALVQKNATGKWIVTSIVARTAGGNQFVSNLARGGTLSKVKDALAKCSLPPSGRGDAAIRLQRAALEIAKGIETYIPAHFGELGIDLALDSSGRVWLLEVNSKPSKNDNTPLVENKVRPSVRNMIQYARYLSGFVR